MHLNRNCTKIMLIVTVICTGILPNNCIVLHQYLYQYSTNNWINICIKINIGTLDQHYCLLYLWVTPNIRITRYLNQYLHYYSSNNSITQYLHWYSNQYSPNNRTNLHWYFYQQSSDATIPQYLHWYSTIFTQQLHQSE